MKRAFSKCCLLWAPLDVIFIEMSSSISHHHLAALNLKSSLLTTVKIMSRDAAWTWLLKDCMFSAATWWQFLVLFISAQVFIKNTWPFAVLNYGCQISAFWCILIYYNFSNGNSYTSVDYKWFYQRKTRLYTACVQIFSAGQALNASFGWSKF